MALELVLLYSTLFSSDDELGDEENQRRDRRTPRISLRRYTESSFRYLFNSGNDQALLNCCGVDHRIFRQLLQLFSPVFHAHTFDDATGRIRKKVNHTGRPKHIDDLGCLGLVLYWFRTRGSLARATTMAFNTTSTPTYKWLKFSRKILLSVLQNHPHAIVTPPTENEVDNYVEAIGRKYPALLEERVWAAADGLKIPLAQSSNWRVQNQFYNAWQASTFVNCVFVFAPDGKIKACVLNAPGTFHDSAIADYGVYEQMEAIYNLYGAKVVVDSAFNLANKNYLVKSSQRDPDNAHGIVLNREATSVRQLSEWGMRMIQGSFPRLKDKLPYEEFNERKIVQHLMVCLYNFQTHNIGINQILNTFMSETEGFYSYGRVRIAETADGTFE